MIPDPADNRNAKPLGGAGGPARDDSSCRSSRAAGLTCWLCGYAITDPPHIIGPATPTAASGSPTATANRPSANSTSTSPSRAADEPRRGQVLPLPVSGVEEGGEAGDGGLLRRAPVSHPLSGQPMMPMLLSRADRKMLTDRVLARLDKEHPSRSCTNEDLRVAIEHEAAALVAEGKFVFRDGALVRRPTVEHDCNDGWVSVEDPVLGGLIDERCPECSP